jgi:hypothetical protein
MKYTPINLPTIITIITLVLSSALACLAQSVAINNTGYTANQSAIMDISSTTTGVLLPRMTEAEKNAIVSPANGLFIYQTNGNAGLWCYDGANWFLVKILIYGCTDPAASNYNPLASSDDGSCIPFPLPIIGDFRDGGIVFWVDGNGGGLVCAPTEQSTGIPWWNGSFPTTGANASQIGTGQANTTAIVAAQGAGSYAAQFCDDLNLNGYNDWFLPSKDELNLMYFNIGQGNALGLGNIGGFASYYYWSSTESASTIACYQSFATGYHYFNFKYYSYYVRAVRAF